MDFAEMKNTESVEDWVNRVANGQHGFESMHLDQLDDGRYRGLAGLNLVLYVEEVLVAVLLQLRKIGPRHEVKHAVVFLSAGVSDDLMRWTPQVWESLDCADEPPTLYLIRDPQIFNDDCEEYRRPVSLPNKDHEGLQAVFRSFRDRKGIENSWEFTTGLYVIASLG